MKPKPLFCNRCISIHRAATPKAVAVIKTPTRGWQQACDSCLNAAIVDAQKRGQVLHVARIQQYEPEDQQ